MNLLRLLGDTTKSKIKIDFLVFRHLLHCTIYEDLNLYFRLFLMGFFSQELIYKIVAYFYEILFDLM